MMDNKSVAIQKRCRGRTYSQLSLSSDSIRLKRRELRRRPIVLCSTQPYWLYLLFCLVGTTDVSFLLFGSNGNSGRTYSYDKNNRFIYRSAAPYCFASEVSEDTDYIKSSRKVKATAVSMKPASVVILPTTNAAPFENSSPKPPMEKLSLNQILYRAGKRGLGGGIPGAIAGGFQVLSLMWLRTIINYQCRYGTTFLQALRTLLNDGGIARLYCGVGFALIQAPLARFVSTAANDGVESLLANLSFTKDWGPGQTTVVASIVVGLWRMLLMRMSNRCTH
jgi:hypothetical protein